MPTTPEFQYTQRWSDIIQDGLLNSVEVLEERDRQLEHHLRGYGTGCSVLYQHPFRWAQILTAPADEQISMLEQRDVSLEHAINVEGGCSLELTFKPSAYWPGLLEGEPWAISCAEENDRAIETRFASCACLDFGLIFVTHAYAEAVSNSSAYVYPADGTVTEFAVQATNCTTNVDWGFTATFGSIDLVSATGGDFDCVLDLATNTLSGTYPPDTIVFGLSGTSVLAGQTLSNFHVFSDGLIATPDPFTLSLTYSEASEELVWSNPLEP